MCFIGLGGFVRAHRSEALASGYQSKKALSSSDRAPQPPLLFCESPTVGSVRRIRMHACSLVPSRTMHSHGFSLDGGSRQRPRPRPRPTFSVASVWLDVRRNVRHPRDQKLTDEVREDVFSSGRT
ncbi:hypothetical protein MPTK1_2g21440 [Marchantia polymorpha subsp. ruderalis]|uniref:Uncharacterized protein n=1 Tax=Marchantia polymorpha TaxID=3197 RepID=A0A2R6X2U5_MARPO|nr:hypothetical protein MARPO_0040s0070 [Marchantia polymorpha]BBN03181.1 hypothetical protein Mp_2g21440 [Marchantia polymorpha subsp. ruderalis]|eukprot:PTQ40396.1 hypothetical protein MARPO_0040s0070 [Marchantia polymorpha]